VDVVAAQQLEEALTLQQLHHLRLDAGSGAARESQQIGQHRAIGRA
jgi:hypothetical protein